MKAVALDHGAARCGVAVSDPSGTIATPLEAIERPATRRGLARVARLVEETGAEHVVVGLPLTLRGEEGDQARAARAFADALSAMLPVPVDLYDERLTSVQADRTASVGDSASGRDSLAAAHLLEAWLAARAART